VFQTLRCELDHAVESREQPRGDGNRQKEERYAVAREHPEVIRRLSASALGPHFFLLRGAGWVQTQSGNDQSRVRIALLQGPMR
jgi:hypothetical protein